jgi:hypothetical protein
VSRGEVLSAERLDVVFSLSSGKLLVGGIAVVHSVQRGKLRTV